MLTEGTLFAGKYRVLRPLGVGGMGAVHEVEHATTGRRLALKTLHASLAARPRERERFLQEARVGSRIASDHVVAVEDAGVDDATGTPWLTMELLAGQHLGDLLAARGPLPLDELHPLFAQLGEALGAAHDAGVIHRDLKPENLFVARVQQHGVTTMLKVLDFGIAQLLRDGATSATVTTGIGSPLWMAPEQAMKGARLKPATDVWPLGLLAFFALTGACYWRMAGRPDVDPAALLIEVVVTPLPDFAERAGELGVADRLPPGFGAWFARCVHRDVTQRFADGRTAARAFAALGARSVVGGTVAIPGIDEVMAHDGARVFGPLLRALDDAEHRDDPEAMIGAGEQVLAMAPKLPDVRRRLARAYEARAAKHRSAGRDDLAVLDQRRASELTAG